MLKTLAGLVPASSGTIEYEGCNIAGLPAPDIARAGIGYVPQGRGLFAGMTVRENLSLGRLARKTDGSHGVVWSEAQILQYFPRLRERMDVAADYLSGGEQQMVAVARALSGDTRILLLDEPFEGLAPVVVSRFIDAVKRIKAMGISLLIAESNLMTASRVADRLYAIDRGEIIFEGEPKRAFENPDVMKTIRG